MSIASDLAELLGAKRVGNSYIGDCPTCGRVRALRIRVGDPLAVPSCRAGCSREIILQAVPGRAIRRIPSGEHEPRRTDDLCVSMELLAASGADIDDALLALSLEV